METRNLNNPSMMSDSMGRPSIKGAFVIPGINFKVMVKPYLAYLPNGTIIGRNKSTEVDSMVDQGGSTTAVTVAGMERWVTIAMYLSPAGASMSFKVISGAQAVNTELIKPARREHIAFTEYDVVIADIRLYYGMTSVKAEDIDLSRSEAANFLDTSLIPVEVYGPPLNAFSNLDQVIQGINSGALDYRYILKDAAPFLKFNLIDTSVCTNVMTPKGDGFFYYVYNGVEKFLALNMGCAACQGACQACQVCEPLDESICNAGLQVAAPYFSYNEGIKRVVLTDPPVTFCPTSCDVTCETSSDTIPCPSCETCEAYCEDYCQIGCMVACDAVDAAAICGDACQATCETACQATCMTFCQVGCEVECQTLAEYPCGNQCEITCQSGYQVI